MALKPTDLRPVMTRIPEGLRRKLEREAGRNDRSMNAEIIGRLEESFQPRSLDLFAAPAEVAQPGPRQIRRRSPRPRDGRGDGAALCRAGAAAAGPALRLRFAVFDSDEQRPQRLDITTYSDRGAAGQRVGQRSREGEMMKGHIRERSPGNWAVVIDVRDPETGKRKRKWHSVQGGKRDAQKRMRPHHRRIEAGRYVEPAKTTLAQFLDRWLDHTRAQVALRTFERYKSSRRRTSPPCSAAPATKLRPEQISRAYAKALVSGRRNGSGGLSPRTVHHMHRILRQALIRRCAGAFWPIIPPTP